MRAAANFQWLIRNFRMTNAGNKSVPTSSFIEEDGMQKEVTSS